MKSTLAVVVALSSLAFGCGESPPPNVPELASPVPDGPPSTATGNIDPAPTATAASVAPVSSGPKSFTHDGASLNLPGPIVFAPNTAKLDETASAAGLNWIHDYLVEKSVVTLMRIEGHTSDDGTAKDKQQTLSEQRAMAVSRWLIAAGVVCTRLVPVGFGGTKPIASSATLEGRASNTRIMAIDASLRGHAIGGMPADGGGRVAGDPCH